MPSSIPLWRQKLRHNFVHIHDLALFLELDETQKKSLIEKPLFPLNLPLRLASKIQKKSLDDPLLLQFVPLIHEQTFPSHFSLDPVKDKNFQCTSRLLQKYNSRVLLVTTGACAMNCRFCFRQNYEYGTHERTYQEELNFIQSDSSLSEVILSGGDPLSLSDEVLEPLLQALETIPHIKRIRFHTRFPIGIPERIDESFLNMISKLNKPIWFVLHINHPRELGEDLYLPLKALRKTGAILLNQTVLLKGVNDKLETLKELFEELINQGIAPYYLHQLDQVAGASHFEVALEEGKTLIQELRKHLPGYGIPHYVQEIAGEASKTILI